MASAVDEKKEPTIRFHGFEIYTGKRYVVDTRYTPVRALGAGAYGVVCQCIDTITNTPVAIKLIPHAYDDLVDAKRVIRELKLMRHFNHPYLVKLLDVMEPVHFAKCDDIYIIMEYMPTDLLQVMTQTSDTAHVQFIMY